MSRAMLDELEKIDVSKEGLHVYMDGMYKKTERMRLQQSLTVDTPSAATANRWGSGGASRSPLGPKLMEGAQRKGKTKPREKQSNALVNAGAKDNGLVLITHGYSTMRYTQGRVRTRRLRGKRQTSTPLAGAVRKYRRHLNPLALAFARGEAEDCADLIGNAVEDIVAEERPHLQAKLASVRACTSDFASGF